MGCREEILDTIRAEGWDDFSPSDVIEAMRRRGTEYQESTIRTHVTSRMCADAPDNHAVTYPDLVRIGQGRYRLRL